MKSTGLKVFTDPANKLPLKVFFTDDNIKYLNLADIAFGLGYVKTAKGKNYIRKDLVAALIKSLAIKAVDSTSGSDRIQATADVTKASDFKHLWVEQGDFFDIALEARTDGARAFRKWVTHEVLPAIANNGVYIADNATEEQINQAKVYHIGNIRKHFADVPYENFNMVYEDVLGYYANKPGAFRRELATQISHGLEDKKAATSDFIIRASVDSLLVRLRGEQLKLNNHVHGGIKAYKTKLLKIKDKVIAEKDTVIRAQVLQITELQACVHLPARSKFKMLPIHGFSHNHMYYDIGAQTVKSTAYKEWLYRFPYTLLPSAALLGLKPDSKLVIHCGFVCIPKFDCQNFLKSIIDVCAEYYGINDNNVTLCSAERWGDCATYSGGKIYIHITKR